jgi:hypothetical protein
MAVLATGAKSQRICNKGRLKDWHNVKEIIRRFSTTALVYGLVSVFYNESFHGWDYIAII